MNLRSALSTFADVGRGVLSMRRSVADEREAMIRSIEARGRVSGAPDIASFLTKLPVYPKADMANIVHEGYFKNELVIAGIRHIVSLFAQARAEVLEHDETVVENHGMVSVIRDPSTQYTAPRSFEYALWEWTLIDMFLSGNCFWQKLRSRSDAVVGIKQLQPHRVAILPDDQSSAVRYFYEDGAGMWNPIPARNVLHWKFPNPSLDPLDRLFGMSPLITAMRVIATDNEMTDFTKTVLQNYAIPGVAIETQQPIDPKSAEEIKRAFRERYGRGRRGDPAILQRGMTLKRVGMDMNELAFDKIRSSTETRVLMVLGGSALVYVAGAQAGMERHTFANYAEARESLADDIVAPLWNRFSGCLSLNFLTDFEGPDNPRRRRVEFNTDKVVAFDARRKSRMETTVKAVISGVLTRDEGRSIVGFKPLGGKDMVYVPLNINSYTVEPNGDLKLFGQPEPPQVEQPKSVKQADEVNEEPAAAA